MFSDRLLTTTGLPVVVLGALAAALVGCTQAPPADTPEAQLQWARAALARNPSLEVVAVDAKGRVISVRDRASGALRSVRLDELAAMPLPAAAAAQSATPSGVAATGTSVTTGTGITTGSSDAASTASPAGVARPGELASAQAGAASPAEAAPETGVAPPAAEVAHASAVPGASRVQMTDAGGREYAIAHDGKGVTITGPGVSITSQPAPAIVTTSTGSLAPAEGTARQSEPLRCQGSKFLRLDNQRLAFSGDGIVAEEGCELYLTNSRVEALGTALVADAAKVHLSNSTLIGGTGSLKMQNGAEVYVGGSTLKGISRRFDSSQLHDLGGNRWD